MTPTFQKRMNTGKTAETAEEVILQDGMVVVNPMFKKDTIRKNCLKVREGMVVVNLVVKDEQTVYMRKTACTRCGMYGHGAEKCSLNCEIIIKFWV